MVTRTISTKLAIEGESEYRASLSRINTEIKTLQSALKLTESQYQNNANSMAALTAKGESLTRLYEAQKSKVAELKSALENAKSAEQNYASQKAELTAKIEANNKALEALKSTSGDTTKEQAALNAENKQLTEELGKCEANLIAAEKGVNNWQTQLNNAEATLNDLDAEIQQNDKYLDEAKESADGCATSIDQYGNKTESATDATKDLNDALAAAGLIAALKKTADAIEACVSAAADFEFSMSGVAAISGATAEEMEILNSKAKEIGATTMYTAQQAAESMQYMALAGWSAAEMIEGIDGVISLAAASGEDLSQVCDIVTDALTAFGLTASDTSRFVDVLASTAANSNTTVHLLGEAFKYAAPVAGALGYSVEDVAVAMGLMANNGIKGGMAGTALRNVFSALADEVKLTGAAFGEATIITTNADGSMKDLSRTIDDLRYYFGQMTQAEQVNNAQALAGQRAYAGLLAILNTTEDDFNTLTAAINESTGAAKQMQDIRMDNFTGQVTLLKSAWDAVKVSLGEQLLPALTSVAAAATDVLSWTADMIEKNQWLAPVITGVATAFGVLAAAVSGYIVVQKIATAVAAAFDAVLSANVIGVVVVALAALATAVALFVKHAQSAVPEVKSLNSAVDNMKTSFAEAADECKSTQTSILGTANIASSYIDRLSELEKQTSMTAAEQDEYRTIVDKLRYLLPDVNIELNEQTGLLIGGAESIRGQVDAWKELAIQEALQKQFTTELEAYADAEAAAEIARVRLSTAEADGLQLAEELKLVHAEYTEVLRELSDLERDGSLSRSEYKEASAALKEEQAALEDQMASLYNEITDNEKAQKDLTGALSESEAALEEYKGPVDEARAAIDHYNEELRKNTDLQGENSEVSSAAASEISDRLVELAEAYKESCDAAYESISAQIGLFDTFAASISEDTNTVEKMMQIWAEQTQNLAEYTENLRRAAEYGVDQGLVLSLSDGSTESAGYIATIVAKIEELGGTTENMSAEAAAFVDEFNAAFARTEEAKTSFKYAVGAIEEDLKRAIAEMEEEAANVNFSGFTDAMNATFSNVGVDFNTIGVDAGSGLASGISTTSSRVSTESRNMAQGAIDAAKSTLESHSDSRVMIGVGKDFVGGMITGVKSREPELKDLVRQAFEAIDTDVKRITTQTCKAAVDEFGKLPAAVRSKLQELKNTISRETSSMPSAMQNTGVQIVDGMIYGMNSRSSSLYYTVRSIVNSAIAAARAAAATASPSKKTTKIFEDVGEGMVVGLERKRAKVSQTARSVVKDAMDEAASVAWEICSELKEALNSTSKDLEYTAETDYAALMLEAKCLEDFLELAAQRNAKIMGENIDLVAKGYRDNAQLLSDWADATGQTIAELEKQLAGSIKDLKVSVEEEVDQMVAAFGDMAGAFSDLLNTIGISGNVAVEYDPEVDYSALMEEAKDTEEFLELAAKRNAKILGENINLTEKGWADNATIMNNWLRSAKENINQIADVLTGALEDVSKKTSKATKDLTSGVADQTKELKSAVIDTMKSMPAELETIGEEMIDGMVKGLNNRSSVLYTTVSNIVEDAIAKAKEAAATASPSRKTTAIFEDVGEGMIVGLERKREKVAETARKVVDEALSLDISDKINRAIGKIDDTIPYLGQPDFKGGDVINNNINLEVHMDGVTVREKADIDEFTDALFDKVRREIRIRGNNALW